MSIMEFEKVNETVNETFTTSKGNFNYKIEVSRVGKEVKSVTIAVTEKSKTGETHAGYLSLNNGTKSANFPLEQNMIPHIEIFEEFLESLKS